MIKPRVPLRPSKPPQELATALSHKPKSIRQQILDLRARIAELRQYSQQHYR